ncbi:MAG: 4Fe-4S dicluster domain-containing protein [Euryarchaeota archaeon]|nr:4Fe-4S dicluster domain-containing protein [Euryarchaeota archaeon]
MEGSIRRSISGEFDLFGVADLRPVKGQVLSCGLDMRPYDFAISIGISLMYEIVDLVPKRDERWAAISYQTHAYDVVNDRLNGMTSRVASVIQSAGYRAMPISASANADDKGLRGLVSHKMAAHLAGLGWIGKSCLLVTPERGPRMRFATVLTNAPLKSSGRPMDPRCGDCMSCVNACPVSAFTGRNYVDGEPREARFDAYKCDRYLMQMETQGKIRMCGVCLYTCPHGRKKDDTV